MTTESDQGYLLSLAMVCAVLGRCRDPDKAEVLAGHIADDLARGLLDDWDFVLMFTNQALGFGVDDVGPLPFLDLLVERCNAHPGLAAAGLRFFRSDNRLTARRG